MYRYHLIAFVTGFVLMVYELVAARLLAPTIGSSTYVWTSVIGVIIAALSVGYWLGGRMSDARQRALDVAWLLIAVGASIMGTLLLSDAILSSLLEQSYDVRTQAVIAATVLFAPSSLLLGMISPYLVRLEVQSLSVAGRTVASLSALNSIGGIVGTFLAGFFLFGWIGSRETLLVLVVLMIAMNWCIVPQYRWLVRITMSIVIIFITFSMVRQPTPGETDTASAHYTIREWQNYSDATYRGLLAGPAGIQSGVDINNPDELVFWYTQALADVVDASPKKDRILMLGGGTLTLPRYLANTHPNSQIDVVEIDPELFSIARDEFFYDDPANVNLIAADARRYIETADTAYDIILVDVFNDGHIPFSMTTYEATKQLNGLLRDEQSVVALNLIAGLSDACRPLLAAVNEPLEQIVGDGVFRFQGSSSQRTNLIAAYGHTSQLGEQYESIPLSSDVLLRDNFAPTEQLTRQCQEV